jgi:hypothetical protein
VDFWHLAAVSVAMAQVVLVALAVVAGAKLLVAEEAEHQIRATMAVLVATGQAHLVLAVEEAHRLLVRPLPVTACNGVQETAAMVWLRQSPALL